MRKMITVIAVVTMMVMSAPAMAGEKCTSSTQDCLDHMAQNLKNRGWVGIEMDDEGGMGKMVITKVVEDSPAETAGFKKGDVLVAVNGVKFSEENQKQIKDVQYAMKPGAEFTYTVARSGKKIDLDIELGNIPDNVMAQWIGGHMMDHAELQMASNE